VGLGVAVRGRWVDPGTVGVAVSLASDVGDGSSDGSGVTSALGLGDVLGAGVDGSTLGSGSVGPGVGEGFPPKRLIAPTAAPLARANDPIARTRTSARA